MFVEPRDVCRAFVVDFSLKSFTEKSPNARPTLASSLNRLPGLSTWHIVATAVTDQIAGCLVDANEANVISVSKMAIL